MLITDITIYTYFLTVYCTLKQELSFKNVNN